METGEKISFINNGVNHFSVYCRYKVSPLGGKARGLISHYSRADCLIGSYLTRDYPVEGHPTEGYIVTEYPIRACTMKGCPMIDYPLGTCNIKG